MTPMMDEQRPAEIDLPLATGWARRREGQAQDHYVVESQLGEGGCGSVFGAKRISDGLSVALKVVEKTERDQFGTPWEVQLMSLVNSNTGHPNILRLHEWFDAPEFYVLVLERPEPCRDLSDFCSPENKLDEQLARGVIQQLLDALLHCQHSGVFHRDVKPANVLINTATLRVTLIDFGLGIGWTNAPYTSFAGTLAFTPPEWFRSGECLAGPATVWSLGVTLFNIVCGYLPYDPLEDPDTMGLIYPEELSPPLVDFMERCLALQVEVRASLEELQHHPWLRPSCIQSGVMGDQDPEEAVTRELYRQMRSVLDQLTPEKFERLMEQVKGLAINTKARLEGVVKMVFEKAICEEKFASTFVKMCRELKELTVPCNDPALPLSFQSLMLDLCQKEALKVICDGVVLQKEWQDQRAAKVEDGQKLQELEAKLTAHRIRAVSSMKLLGVLHEHGMVKDGVILECVAELLDTKSAEALECLCCLMTTAGSILASEELKPEMDRHFRKIESILRERRLSARLCFMLQDVLELRQVHTRERKRITEALQFSEDVKLSKAEDPCRPSFQKGERQHRGQHHDQVRQLKLNDGEHQGHAPDQRWHHGKRQGHAQDQRWYHGERQGQAQIRRQHQGERYYQGQQEGLRHGKHQDHCQDQRRNHEEHQCRAQNQRRYHREHGGGAPDQTRYGREHHGHDQRQRWHHGEHEGRAQDLRRHHGEHEGRAQDLRWHHGEHEGRAQDLRWHHGEHEGRAQDLRWHGEHEGRAQHQKWHHGEHHGRVPNQRPFRG